MLSIPDTFPIDMAPLKSTLRMPYTLTPGRAAGTFLAEIGKGRIVGSKFSSGTVIAPAQDFCPKTGDSDPELVEVPSTGTLNGFTKVGDDIIGLITLDGTALDFPHRIIDADYASLKVGDRVAAVFVEGAENSILSISGFKPAPGAPVGEVRPLTDPAAPLTYADGARAKKLADAQCRGRVRTSIYDRFDDAGAAWVFPGGCA